MVYTLQEHDYGWHIKQLGSVVELVIKLIIWLAIITFVIPNHIIS
jgi:hypothetical protein